MNTTESLQNQVKLINTFNKELERQIQNCRKENMSLIQQIQASYRQHDKTTSELNQAKSENERLLKEVFKKNEQLKRLQQIEQIYLSTKQQLNRQLIQKQNYQNINQINQYKIKELTTKLNYTEQSYLQKINNEITKNTKLQNQIASIKQSIIINQNQYSKLTLELENKNKEFNQSSYRCNQQVKHLQVQNTNLLSKLHVQQEKNIKTQQNLAASITNNQHLHNVIKTLQNNINQLKVSLKQQRSLAVQNKNTIESKQKDIQSKDNNLKTLQKEVINLKRTIQTQKYQHRSKSQQITQLQTELNKQKDLIQANLILIEQSENHVKALELQLNQVKDTCEINFKEIGQKNKIIIYLKEQLLQLNEAFKLKSKDLEAKEAQFKKIQGQLVQSVNIVSIKTIQLQQKNSNIKQISQELKISKKNVEQKLQIIEQKNQCFNQLNIQIKQLQDLIQNKKKQLLSKDRDIIKLESEVRQQKRKKEEQISTLKFQKQRQIDVLNYKLKQFEDRIEHKQKTLVAAFSNNQNLNNIVSVYDKKIASISNLLDQEVKLTAQFRLKIHEKQQQLNTKQAKIQQILLQIEELKTTSSSKIERLNLSLKEQRQNKQKQIKQNQELSLKYHQLMQQKTGGQATLTQQIQSRDQMIQQLRNKYELLQKSFENAKEQHKSQKHILSQKLINLQKNHTNLNEGKSSLETIIKESEDQIALLKKELSTQKQQFKVYKENKETEVQKLTKNTKQLQLSVEQRSKEVKNLQNERQLLKQDFIQQKLNIEVQHDSQIEQQKVNAAKQSEELKIKFENKLNEKQLEITTLKTYLETQALEQKQKLKQQKQQNRKKQASLAQKIQLLQKQIYRMEGQIASSSISNIIEGRFKNEKETQLAALRKVISDQQKLISDQRNSLDKLNTLFKSKEQEIQALQTSNTLLRNQLINSLVNEQSSRKQNILQRQKSATSLKRLSTRQFKFEGRRRATFLSQVVGAKTDRVQQMRYVSKDNCASNEGSMKRSIVQEVQFQTMPHTPSIQQICS